MDTLYNVVILSKKNDLCKTHNNMLEKHGVLRYGTTDLPKPRHDFISGKLLNWK